MVEPPTYALPKGLQPITIREMKKLHPAVKELLTEIEAYRARSGVSRTKFGIDVLNDSHLVGHLETGRMPTIATIERIRAFISKRTKAVIK